MSDSVLMSSLRILSDLLNKHYQRKVIILIDEYDVPLAKANDQGYYDQMVTLIRNMFEQALKTNEALYFAVLTGCLRVAKESIFTGLNNPKNLSITTARFDEYFGFTDDEVKEMLKYYDLEEKYHAMKEWYDGYHFGNVDVYCPWDVISYCDELTDDPRIEPRDYWSNTSSNDVVRHFIEKTGNGLTKSEIEALVAGKTVTKEICEQLTYNQLYDSIEHIWSVLFATGYLTQRGKPDGNRMQLAIPNMEIRNIFTSQIMNMFRKEAGRDGELLSAFCDALQTGNGYGDIIVKIESKEIGIVIEVKYAGNSRLETACREALAQIEKEKYDTELREEGYHTIYKFGIACYKKKCKVMSVKVQN